MELLVDAMGTIYYNDCENSSLCCCFVWDLEKSPLLSNESANTVRILPAFRGKPDFMKLLMDNGLISSLPEESSLVLEEMHQYLFSIIYAITGRYSDIHSTVEAALKLARDHFFRCKDQQFYKRVFLAVVAIQAIQYNLDMENNLAEEYISCLRIYFAATRDPFLTIFEVRSILYSCFVATNKLCLFDDYCQEFDKLMPECPVKLEPRKLTDLARCQIRENLSLSKLPLPKVTEKLLLPNFLKSFVLGNKIDISRSSGTLSAQRAVTQSELSEMLLEF